MKYVEMVTFFLMLIVVFIMGVVFIGKGDPTLWWLGASLIGVGTASFSFLLYYYFIYHSD